MADNTLEILNKLKSGVSENNELKHNPDVDPRGLPDLDSFFRFTQPTGSLDKALGNTFYGFNHRNIKSVIPDNRDSYGYVFFTRPGLNLSSANIRNVRKLYSLLTTEPKSVHRFIRCLLDPRLIATTNPQWVLGEASKIGMLDIVDQDAGTPVEDGKMNAKLNNEQGRIGKDEFNILMGKESGLQHFFTLDKITCPLIDNNNGFMPILTNLIQKCDGWPDPVVPNFTSQEGVRREQWSIVDGTYEINEVWDLNTSFRNIKDEPLILLFETWLKYMSYVYEGLMSPYMDFIVENEIDYMSRVFRLVLDESKTFVKKIASTAAAFPVNVPSGQFFDYDSNTKYNDNTKEISIRWRCHGAEYNDFILIDEFNRVNTIFNTEYAKYYYNRTQNSHNMVEIPFNMLHLFNYRGYPYIDPNTLELKWLINKESKTYERVLKYCQFVYNENIGSKSNFNWRDFNTWNLDTLRQKEYSI